MEQRSTETDRGSVMNIKITLNFMIVLGLLTTAFVMDHQKPENLDHKIVTGTLSGFDCAVVGVLCPTTHRGADYTTGVFTEDGRFFFVVNIPQSFLQQYFREEIEVEGEMYDSYDHAIEPERIHLIEDNERRLVYESGYFIDEDGNRATFQDGVFRNGRWNVAQ